MFRVVMQCSACHTGLQPATAVQAKYPDQDVRESEQIDSGPGVSRTRRA